jgi:hypothetical protein
MGYDMEAKGLGFSSSVVPVPLSPQQFHLDKGENLWGKEAFVLFIRQNPPLIHINL